MSYRSTSVTVASTATGASDALELPEGAITRGELTVVLEIDRTSAADITTFTGAVLYGVGAAGPWYVNAGGNMNFVIGDFVVDSVSNPDRLIFYLTETDIGAALDPQPIPKFLKINVTATTYTGADITITAHVIF